MKRLRRRVDNSECIGTSAENGSSSSSKTLTFDRRTFFECSNRMKRIVPTLVRRRINSKSEPGSLDLLSQVLAIKNVFYALHMQIFKKL